jgi:hypothetical protein
MLIQYVSFLVLLMITVSCASSSDDGAEVTVSFSFSFSQVGEVLIDEALNTPEISSQLTSPSHAILSSIAAKNKYGMSFYDFAVQSYNFNKLGFDSQDPQYWNAFINYPFREFLCQQPDQAQVIINEIVLPNHPFLSQVPFTFETAQFFNQSFPDPDVFLDKVANNIFGQQYLEILSIENPSEAQILLKALLRKAKSTSFPDPEFKYHHAFLTNAPFYCFKRINFRLPEYHNNIYSFLSHLAPEIYLEISEDANQLLAALLPSVHSALTDGTDNTYATYIKTIGAYQESLLQPIDNTYLWDPELLHGDLLEALQKLSFVEDPNFPPYLKIIEFLSSDSPIGHLFYHYIAQNYCKPSHLSTKHQPLFWRSLIFSSFSGFSSLFPQYSHQILQQLLPSLGQIQYIFVDETLQNALSSNHQFVMVSGWGHSNTVDLFLEYRTNLSADCVGLALEYASEGGHKNTIDRILQRYTEISAHYIGRALACAATGGRIYIVDFYFKRRTAISADFAGKALENAAQNGHTCIVDYLLRFTDISISYVGRALEIAVKGGHAPTVDFLLEKRTDISVDNVGWTLGTAAEGGHTLIVELLLRSRSDIAADKVGRALCYAAEGGHSTIVEILLRSRSDINADKVGSALRCAAGGGHTLIVDLLLQSRRDITVEKFDSALRCASQGEHHCIIDLLQRRLDIVFTK